MSPDFVFNDRVKLEADEWKELRALTNNTDTRTRLRSNCQDLWMSWPQKIGAVDVDPPDVARLDRKLDATDAERRRLVDLYQAGLIELPEPGMRRWASSTPSAPGR